MIYVCGANKELGNTYKLTIPEGSVIAETVSVGEEGWKYTKQTISRYQEDMYGANVNIDYKLTDRVVVETPNGATKTYVIVYAQDSYGAIPSALTDENNIFSQEPVITTGTTNLTIHNQDGTYTIDETYVIQVAGGNKELGSTYQLALPEGAEIVSVIHPGDEAWKYKEDKYSVTYENILGVVSREYAYFADLVVIRAANGAERMYAIAYLQDTSGIEAFTVEDTENEGFEVMDFDTTPTEINVTAVDETGAEITKTKEVYVFRVQGSNETLGNTYTLQMPEGTTEISRISNTQEDWKYQDTTVDKYTYESEVTIKATNGAERTYLIAYKQVNN